ALLAVGDLIRNNEISRDRFGKCKVTVHLRAEANGLPNQKPPPGTPTSADLVLLQLACDKLAFELRSSAAYTYRCFLEDNMDAQLTLAASLADGNSQVGRLLLSTLLDLELSRKDPYRTVFSTSILATALLDNPHAKDVVLASGFEEHGERISLLNKICYSLLCAQRDNFDPKIQIGLLSLLSVWLFDHARSVKEFLGEGSNVQYVGRRGVYGIVAGRADFAVVKH
ncbi:hypothetical protein HDU91_004603, partial [Kappamyces sp. JEL0680]